MTRTIWTTLLAAALTAPFAHAGQTWNFDITTTGNDVNWTSPTSVDPAASVYSVSYDITTVEVDVTFLGLPFNDIDVTNQIPPELKSASLEVPGPAPVQALNLPIVAPPPPEPLAFAATLSFGLDAAGAGFLNATGVTLGSLQITLPIFGLSTVTLTSIRLAGSLTMHGAWFDLGSALAGSTGLPSFVGAGSLIGGELLELTLTNAAPSRPVLFIVGINQVNAPFWGGTMVPSFDIILNLATDPTGGFALPSVWPVGVPPGFPLYMQCWVLNAGGNAVDGASNALKAVAQ